MYFDTSAITVTTSEVPSSSGWIGTVISILVIVAQWLIFQKAGEKGWKAIIPIYNVYTLYKISGKVGLWIQGLISGVVSVILLIVFVFGIAAESGAPTLISIALLVVVGIWQIVIRYKQCKGLSEHFGEGTGFALGLFFFESIFMLILAFGHYQYQSKED